MTVLSELKALLNPKASYKTGTIISIKDDKAVVSTSTGRLECTIQIKTLLGIDDLVHIEDGKIIGKLKDENLLPKYYV